MSTNQRRALPSSDRIGKLRNSVEKKNAVDKETILALLNELAHMRAEMKKFHSFEKCVHEVIERIESQLDAHDGYAEEPASMSSGGYSSSDDQTSSPVYHERLYPSGYDESALKNETEVVQTQCCFYCTLSQILRENPYYSGN